MKIQFLVAEEIRPELGGKMTILGFMPNNTLLITSARPANAPEDAKDGIDRLALLVTISDVADGVHKFKGQIFCPSGEPYNPETSFGEGAVARGTSHAIIFELKPFIIKEYGVYRFDFYVNNELEQFQFEIRIQPKNQSKYN